MNDIVIRKYTFSLSIYLQFHFRVSCCSLRCPQTSTSHSWTCPYPGTMMYIYLPEVGRPQDTLAGIVAIGLPLNWPQIQTPCWLMSGAWVAGVLSEIITIKSAILESEASSESERQNVWCHSLENHLWLDFNSVTRQHAAAVRKQYGSDIMS